MVEKIDDRCVICGALAGYACRLNGRCKAMAWKFRKEREKHGVSEIISERSPAVVRPA